MNRCLLILALLAVLPLGACGGGSGSGTTTVTTDVDTDQVAAARARIQQLLEGCAASSTDELLALIQILSPFLTPDSTAVPPGLSITGFSLLNGTVDWAMDIENDGTDDATGTAGFRTPSDTPYVPLDFLTLLPPLGDVSNLPTVLAGLPDGTILRTTFNLMRGVTANGSADVVFANPDGTSGAPSATSGNISIVAGDCTTSFTWTDAPIPDLSSPTFQYPTTDVGMSVQSPDDRVTGTLAFDGDETAILDATLQSTGTSERFILDLSQGTLTPAP